MSNGSEASETTSWWSRPAGGREVLQIAVPMVVTTLSWTLMQFIDSAILMQVSGTAMAAAYQAGIIWFASISLFWGICSYSATFVAQYFGDEQPNKIGPAVWQGAWLALSFSLLVPVAQWFAPQLFDLFGHEKELARLEALFFQILCYGAPGMLIAQSLECFYSGRGKTWVVMVVDAGAVVVNLILALMLVRGWFGIESWGIDGAAWATVLAQWWRAVSYAVLILLPANRAAFNTADFKPDRQLLRRMIRFGGPSGMQMMLDVTGFALFMMFVAKIGVAEAEATSLAFRVSQVAFMPVWGLGMATAVLVGQKLGEDRPELAQRAARTTLSMSLVYMGVISLVFVFAPRVFLQTFFTHGEAPVAAATEEVSPGAVAAESTTAAHDEPAKAGVEAMTSYLMRFVAAYNMFDAAVIILVSVLRGAGDTRFVMIVSCFMSAMVSLGSYLGVNVFNFNVYGAWWFIAIWVSTLAVIYVLRYRTGKWQAMRVIDQIHHAH
ncbi:MATE family efflux transporter [Lacipirellula sp.]|uniref:MATE family efflux transporter n=1 Tax=Lacipirellula sp. TaxID=2691419 RepID=UPI003D136D84